MRHRGEDVKPRKGGKQCGALAYEARVSESVEQRADGISNTKTTKLSRMYRFVKKNMLASAMEASEAFR